MQANKEVKVFKVEQNTNYQPFDEERFKIIVSMADQKRNSSNMSEDLRQIQHLSIMRQAPVSQFAPEKALENIEKRVTTYRSALIGWASKTFIK